MAISRLYTFVDGVVPTAAQLNGEFNNIINNARDLISPLTSSLDMNGNELILDADADTSIIASTDDRIDIKASGVSSLYRFDATVSTPVNGVHFIAAATGVNPRVEADGTDTNVGLRLAGQGTGATLSDGPVAMLAQMMGFSNVAFTATVASNALTIALKDAAGNDPSTASPCKVWMRSATLTTGAPVALSRTSALSIVIPSTAELGTVNSVAARIYWGATTTDGTTWDALCVFNTQGTNQLHPLPSESAVHSATAIGTGSDSAGVLYASSATTNMPVKWLGYIEITEATAGTWGTAPTVLQMLGPGVPRSGSRVQMRAANTSSPTNSTSATFADTALSVAITPTNACNRVLVTVFATSIATNANDTVAQVRLQRDTGGSTTLATFEGRIVDAGSGGDQNTAGSGIVYLDAPAVTVSTTYKTQVARSSGTGTVTYNQSGVSSILVEEVFV